MSEAEPQHSTPQSETASQPTPPSVGEEGKHWDTPLFRMIDSFWKHDNEKIRQTEIEEGVEFNHHPAEPGAIDPASPEKPIWEK